MILGVQISTFHIILTMEQDCECLSDLFLWCTWIKWSNVCPPVDDACAERVCAGQE